VLPGIAQFRDYQRGWLRGDLLAGITVAAYLVPQVMAYAEVAGLPPVTGLWAMLGPLVVYTLMGSSRQLSVGPESTTALMTAVVLMPLAAGDPVRYATLAAALAVMVGLICVMGGLARLGFLADLLSKPVLVGYMAGVAVIMMVSQLSKISGVPVEGDGFLAEVAHPSHRGRRIPSRLPGASWGAAARGAPDRDSTRSDGGPRSEVNPDPGDEGGHFCFPGSSRVSSGPPSGQRPGW